MKPEEVEKLRKTKDETLIGAALLDIGDAIKDSWNGERAYFTPRKDLSFIGIKELQKRVKKWSEENGWKVNSSGSGKEIFFIFTPRQRLK